MVRLHRDNGRENNPKADIEMEIPGEKEERTQKKISGACTMSERNLKPGDSKD